MYNEANNNSAIAEGHDGLFKRRCKTSPFRSTLKVALLACKTHRKMISDRCAIKGRDTIRALNACNNMHFIRVILNGRRRSNIQRPESVFRYSTPNRQTEIMELVPPTNNMNANSTAGMILIDQAYHTITCGMVGDAIKNH